MKSGLFEMGAYMGNTEEQQQKHQVGSLRLHLLISQGPTAIITSVALTIFLIISLLMGVINQEIMSVWIVLIVTVAIFRILVIKKIKNALNQNNMILESNQIKSYEQFRKLVLYPAELQAHIW